MPGKPLADIGGKPMIEHVYRRTLLATTLDRVIVATDDERIAQALDGIAEVAMTRADHPSGTDRVAEVVMNLETDIAVNVQGDLPLLDPAMIDALVVALRMDVTLGMATLAVAVANRAEIDDPSVVKVVCDAAGRALYFSRAAIPHHRDTAGGTAGALHHVGIYAYRKETLLRLASLAPTPLECAEKLEQLRALENGIAIGVVTVEGTPLEVDTSEDLERAREAITRL